MSPTGRETVVNKALSGGELKKIILADCQRLVDAEGLLSEHIAFGRVAYSITLRLQIDNPYAAKDGVTIVSVPKRDSSGQLGVVESLPLASPSPATELGAMTLDRKIDSPNAERLREGLPVPVVVKGQDGTTQTESIKYPPDAFPELGPGEVIIADVSAQERARFGLVEPETQPTAK
jgi:hypothetical protein